MEFSSKGKVFRLMDFASLLGALGGAAKHHTPGPTVAWACILLRGVHRTVTAVSPDG
jgi:hypothetical protein